MPEKPVDALVGRTIRCILFDLGDTLWSRKDMQVWRRMEDEANLRAIRILQKHISPEQLPTRDLIAAGQQLRAIFDEQIRTLIRRDPEFEPDGSHAMQQALRSWGIPDLDIAVCAEMLEGLRVRIPESRPLDDDVLSTLEELQQRGFLLGIVTNRHWGGPLFHEDLQQMGLLKYFDRRHLAISVDLGIRKPNAAIFLHTLNALQVPPQEAAMVGDSLLSDVLGGQLLGMLTIWKPKAHLRDAIYSRKLHGSTSSASISTVVDRPDELPEGMHITDDDYVLAQVQSRAGKWDEHMQRTIRPDIRIDKISDLLDIFSKAGPQ